MPAEMAGSQRRRVVIVGGGFGGLAAAQKLRHADVDVTLVDRKNHHLFQALLYQLAAGAISAGECAAPIRTALNRSSNTKVLRAEVTDVDAERRQVMLDRGERLDYDSLIVACGARTFAIYLSVHLYYLGGGVGRRLGVLTDWVTARIGHPQNQLIEGELESVERVPPTAEGFGNDPAGTEQAPDPADYPGAMRS